MTKSAVRAIHLLELLAESDQPLSHREITDAMRMPKSSVTELLSAMAAHRYVRRAGVGGERFSLGAGALPLASAIMRQTDIVQLAQPLLQAMMQRTGESAALVVRSGDEVVVIARVICSHPVAYALPIGHRAPLHATAAGKALLGAASQRDRERYIKDNPLRPITTRTITEAGVLRRQLEEIAHGAVAFAGEELFEGVITMALAVVDADGAAVASLSIGMPSMRFTPEKAELISTVLRESTAELSAALGWRGGARESSHAEQREGADVNLARPYS